MARRLSVPKAWLKKEAGEGRIPCVRADTELLFDPLTVERLLLARAREHMDCEPYELLPVTRMAKRCGLTREELKALAVARQIPSFTVGTRFVFDPEAVGRVLMARALEGGRP